MGSRIEDILSATISGESYNKPTESRIEKLLIDLKDVIEAGGGGGTSIKYGASIEVSIDPSTYIMTIILKDQNGDTLGVAQTVDLPLESMVVSGSYNSTNKKVVLTLKNGETVEFSVADLVAGLQTELSASNKLNPEYINYDSTHRAVSDTEKSTWNDKQSALTTEQLAAVNSGIDSTKVEQIETNKNNISTEQSKTTGMTEGGSNYITVGGIRVYVSATAPTGARTGDLWIGG